MNSTAGAARTTAPESKPYVQHDHQRNASTNPNIPWDDSGWIYHGQDQQQQQGRNSVAFASEPHSNYNGLFQAAATGRSANLSIFPQTAPHHRGYSYDVNFGVPAVPPFSAGQVDGTGLFSPSGHVVDAHVIREIGNEAKEQHAPSPCASRSHPFFDVSVLAMHGQMAPGF